MEEQRWQYFNSPSSLWSRMPGLLITEISIYLAAILTLYHALKQPKLSPSSFSVWISAFIAGATTDAAFALLPIADNFWHAQATFMITARVPLFVPCLYVFMLYIPYIISSQTQIPLLGRVTFGGLIAACMLHPYDNLSSTFLFTTWHDTDPLVAVRFHGNPVGNLIFCLLYGASFHLWLYFLPRFFSILQPIISCLLAIPSVILFSTLVQIMGGNFSGVPAYMDLLIITTIFAICLTFIFSKYCSYPSMVHRHGFLLIAQLLYQGTLLGIAIFADPERHVSVGYHQEIGPCNETVVDKLSGVSKLRFLCATNYTERFSLHCPSLKSAHSSSKWYTICGHQNEHYGQHIVSTFAAIFLSTGGQELMARAFFRQRIRMKAHSE